MKRKPLYFMTDDGGAGDGAGDGSGDGGAGGAAGAAKQGADGAGTDEGKTFTQADVDRIIAGRLAKFADYDEVKKQLADVQAANQTESEKAIKAAKEEARQAALAEAGPRLVAAEFRIALAGRRTAEEVSKLIEDYDLSKYLTDAGEVDTKRVTEKAELLAPPEKERKAAPSFGGGARKSADKAEPAPGLDRLRQAYADTSTK